MIGAADRGAHDEGGATAAAGDAVHEHWSHPAGGVEGCRAHAESAKSGVLAEERRQGNGRDEPRLDPPVEVARQQRALPVVDPGIAVARAVAAPEVRPRLAVGPEKTAHR